MLENIATILQQQTAQIVSGNQLVIDQTGKITIGNTLTGEQTANIITGNATSDAIKAITRENKSYSEQMLEQLAKSGTTQTSSLADVVTQTSLIVAAVHQLIQLTAEDLAAKEAAAAKAAADKLAAEQKAAADKLAAEQAALLAAQIAQATAAYNAQAATAESYRSQWDQFATSHASPYFTERQENIETGTPYSVTGYYSYSDAERAWLSQTVSAYQSAFAAAYDLWKAIPGHATGLDYVPKDDYLMRAHEGEAVLSPPDAARWRSGKTGSNSNVILIEEIRALRAEIKAGNVAIAKNTGKMAKVLDYVDQEMNTDGLLIRTS
ncbi:MAG: hypothetical protein BWY07_02761 [Candidatus Hydrogenedentes bacterium ADurb.Bin170]|nr:MAG: hypothetical protein BWY07_02761 [Candidatus Hydrogenedentes bacterium ADurb.Bin170]